MELRIRGKCDSRLIIAVDWVTQVDWLEEFAQESLQVKDRDIGAHT
jgi:hypothetical protein